MDRWRVAGALRIRLLIKAASGGSAGLPLLVAFAFVDPQRRRAASSRRAAIGVGAAILLLALLLDRTVPPSNPIAAFVWLLERYAYGSNVVSVANSVNAFNLWAVRGTLWVPDTQPILGLKQYVWGVLLVLAALGLIVLALPAGTHVAGVALKGCAIATLAFFVLATRMHERYSFQRAALYHRLHPICATLSLGRGRALSSCFSPTSSTASSI